MLVERKMVLYGKVKRERYVACRQEKKKQKQVRVAWLGDQDFTSLFGLFSPLHESTWLAYFSTLVFHQQSLDSVATCAEGV